MTIIAVTASICASASEAALLVASFMSISLAHDPPKCERFVFKMARVSARSGVIHRGAKIARTMDSFYSEHPSTSIRFDESPLSEYRR